MLDPQLVYYRERCLNLLKNLLAAGDDLLHQAMRYSVLAEGKRLRPLLVYAAAEIANAKLEKTDNAAMAVELIHVYSLIHDDLPAMDDAELRRGQLTCHRQFNEAVAILAGDALQSLAFEVLANNANITQLKKLAHAIGVQGMVLGQGFDLQAEQQQVSLTTLQKIHAHKTGALITTCLQLGAQGGELDHAHFKALTLFGENLGLAFQIQDDILDCRANLSKLGKIAGSDARNLKSTYVTLLGINGAEQELDKVYRQALYYLQLLPNNHLLSKISHFVIERDY